MDRMATSGMSTSMAGSVFTVAKTCEAEETFRKGVDVETALGSFFLCERVPLLVRCGVGVPDVVRAAGVAGDGATGLDGGG